MTRSAAHHAWVVGLGTAVVPLDTAVNIAFPAITSGFDLATPDIQWVVIAYVLTYTALTLALGRIGDIYGHALVFRAGLAWSAVAFLLCALAPTFAGLLVCRFLQGIGAALVLSCGVALATSAYGEDRRSRVLGIYTMMFAAGLTLGPWIGGVLVQMWGWPAVFWFRAPIAVAALVLARGLPVPPPSAREPFDLAGAVLLAAALTAMLLAFNRIGDFAALPLGLAALAAFVGFFRHEARCAKPIIDVSVFRLPGFAAVNLANVLTNLAAFAVWLLVPFHLARASGLSLALSGAVLATGSLGMVVAPPLAGRLVGRVGAERLALAGAVLVGVGLALIATWERGAPVVWLVATLTLQGFGAGLFQLAYTDIVTAALPPQNRGVAGSLAMVTRTVGTVSAAAIVMLLFQRLEAAGGFFAAFRQTFALVAVLPLAMAALLALRRRR
ncbi:MAG TPA: MFS transporter [Xanthobacteraceae bacterium]|jgi:MFS family permease|nr:MFS transporter [Xanthobacteraceae bacterium]